MLEVNIISTISTRVTSLLSYWISSCIWDSLSKLDSSHSQDLLRRHRPKVDLCRAERRGRKRLEALRGSEEDHDIPPISLLSIGLWVWVVFFVTNVLLNRYVIRKLEWNVCYNCFTRYRCASEHPSGKHFVCGWSGASDMSDRCGVRNTSLLFFVRNFKDSEVFQFFISVICFQNFNLTRILPQYYPWVFGE